MEEVFGEGGIDVYNSEGGSASSLSQAHAVETKSLTECKFVDLFKKDVRGRTIHAVFLMGFLQLSGIDAVLYVSSALSFLSYAKTRSLTFPSS